MTHTFLVLDVYESNLLSVNYVAQSNVQTVLDVILHISFQFCLLFPTHLVRCQG
jgi:hypothetical protein